jgi:hypothetical protein
VPCKLDCSCAGSRLTTCSRAFGTGHAKLCPVIVVILRCDCTIILINQVEPMGHGGVKSRGILFDSSPLPAPSFCHALEEQSPPSPRPS